MSRCGYSDDLDALDLGRWRGQVASAIRGKRGQKFFTDLVAALDALPEPRLIMGDLESAGEVCALGALGKARSVDIGELDTEDYEALGEAFDIAYQLAQEVMYVNDDWCWRSTPEERWRIVRGWAAQQLSVAPPATEPESGGAGGE